MYYRPHKSKQIILLDKLVIFMKNELILLVYDCRGNLNLFINQHDFINYYMIRFSYKNMN